MSSLSHDDFTKLGNGPVETGARSAVVVDQASLSVSANQQKPGIFNSLTSMRFIAAFFVVVHHTSAICYNIVLFKFVGGLGWLGVSYFFILSGFVLMWSFDREVSAGAYLFRRLTRIYPLHVLCLLASLLFFLGTGRSLGGYVGTLPGTIANFFLMQDWIPGHPKIRQAWNGVSWTLSCEFFFYLLAPLVFPNFLKLQRLDGAAIVIFGWLTLAVLVMTAQFEHWNRFLDFYMYYPLPRSSEFFLGALGAQWIKSGSRFLSVKASLAIMLLPVLVYEFTVPIASQCPELLNILFIPGAFLLILAAAGAELDGSAHWLQHRFMVRLGDASFALYMIHALLLGLFAAAIQRYFDALFFSSRFVESIFATGFVLFAIAASVLVHNGFEHPVRIALLRLKS